MAKVALVTGANTGIGYAIAERLLRDGWALGFATQSRDEDKYGEAFERLSQLGDVHWVAGDLSDPDVPERLVARAVEGLGSLDALVNNAGLSTKGPALELTREDFDLTFAVDVRAAFLLSQHAARAMGDRGGVIVNVTSIHEHIPRVGFAIYAAAKAALGMLTRSLALEWAERGIRVVAVAPGLIATPRNVEAEQLDERVPLGRAGRPEEVAAVVAFVLSDEASYVSGASWLVDGAVTTRPLTDPAD